MIFDHTEVNSTSECTPFCFNNLTFGKKLISSKVSKEKNPPPSEKHQTVLYLFSNFIISIPCGCHTAHKFKQKG